MPPRGRGIWLAAFVAIAAVVASAGFAMFPSERAVPPSRTEASTTAVTATTARTAPARTAPAPSPSGAKGAAGVLALAGGYVDNGQCLDCHEAAGAAWKRSQHFKAMAHATEATVLGDFNDASFTFADVTSRFFRREGKFFVSTDGPDGTIADFEIKYTFGVEPLQQYLIELPGGRLQALTIAWDTREKRWFHLFPHESAPPGDVLHWTGRYQNWNLMCAACHSTNLVKNYDAATDSYQTTWSEINVSCQSCHGPGQSHVDWAKAAAPDSSRQASADPHMGLSPDFRAMDSRTQVEVCAPCHARRSELTAAPVAGQPLMDTHRPSTLDDALYFADGQQHDEVYIYGSFRQSKMYDKGVACTDCHDPHTAKLKADGNAVCTQCHQPAADTRFPTLRAKLYDDPSHTFHPAGSEGGQCVACHMPTRNYMIVDPRHDHGFKIPRPDLSAKLGVPNACVGCHAERTDQWAAEAVAKWYGGDVWRGPHFGETIAAARSGAAPVEDVAALAADPERPAIIRASALDLLANYGPAAVGVASTALSDADPAVRVAAVAAVERAPVEDRSPLLAPLLGDPVRAVRIEAARVLSTVPRDRLDARQAEAFDAALAEFVAVQSVGLDTPGAHLNLAVVDANMGRYDSAERHYRAALALDPDFTPARVNLAQLLSGRARDGAAEEVLRAGLARVPEQGDLHYMLGLLLAQNGRMAEAATALGEAARLHPDRARVRYNHALALIRLGRIEDAEAALLEAQRLDPRDPAIPYALVMLYLPRQRVDDAYRWSEKALELSPNDPQLRQLRDKLRQGQPAPGASPGQSEKPD